MPFCPKCEEEFRAEIGVCGECNVKLVDSLEGGKVEIEELEVVCSLSEEEKAHIVRGYLESEGIPCVLESASFHAGAGPATDLTEARLWSHKDDAPRARQLISEHEDFSVCSACGHVAEKSDSACVFCGEAFGG